MSKRLEKGDKAPEFNLLNQFGNEVKLSDYKGKKIILYFYPKASTPGCTTQSCSLRDEKENFFTLGVEVIGISNDPPKRQLNFDQKNSLNFNLLCDEDHAVSESFGVWGEKKLYGKTYMGLIRSSFLIDEEGNILEAWYKVSPKDTVPKAINFLSNNQNGGLNG